MPLSTSNFRRAIPSNYKTKHLVLGLLVGLLLILATENMIRMAGGLPDVRDTKELWASNRARASALGKDVIIIVGSSRVQLGIDLKELERFSSKKVVQLAIDGSSYLDILDHLAEDQSVMGTILISSNLQKLYSNTRNERPRNWIEFYDQNYRNLWSPKIEQRLKASLQSISALYSNIIPIESLAPILFSKARIMDPYLTTLPSRERNADYSKVKMPAFYINRVIRNLGYALPHKSYKSHDEFAHEVIRITKEHHKEKEYKAEKFVQLESALVKLKSRGVKVAIIHFPLSGLVETINDIRYPKRKWDEITSKLNATFIDYRDYPQLRYNLADGSHLDFRQKGEFTKRLAAILMEKGVIPHSP